MGIDDTQQFPGKQTQELPKTMVVKQTRRVLVGILGGAIVLVGIILIPLPGPGIIIVLVGLTVLSWEFKTAKRIKHQMRMKVKDLRSRTRKSPKP